MAYRKAGLVAVACLCGLATASWKNARGVAAQEGIAVEAHDFAARASRAELSSLVAVQLVSDCVPEEVAAEHGVTLRHAIGSMRGWWLFEAVDGSRAQAAAVSLRGDPRVIEVQEQRASNLRPWTNDTHFGQQWHLKKSGAASVDINAEPAWAAGFTGTGIRVMLCDDSLTINHPDIAANYNAADSYDYADNDTDPSPGSQDKHGTACGGLIAAKGENNAGVCGVAYDASLSCVRMNWNFTDAQIASELSHARPNIAIYSNSWGPQQPYTNEVGPLTRQAINDGATLGRGGLGCIYLFAAGNGRDQLSNANDSGLAELRQNIFVSSIAIDGKYAAYSEAGACILVCAPAGLSTSTQTGNIITTDNIGSSGYNGMTDQDYTNGFGGTSASCPIAAGVVALMLEANPNLTWRDVQHVLLRSANTTTGVSQTGWVNNGVNLRVHETLGFGCVDAGAAVSLAQTWTNVGAEQQLTPAADNAGVTIPDGSGTLTRTINVPSSVYLEHVLVTVNSTHTTWTDLEIILTSPSGTQSKLAQDNPMGGWPFPFPPPPGFPSGAPQNGTWTFSTVRNWGEDSAGNWTLTMRDKVTGGTGSLTSWSLKLFGTNTPHVPLPVPPPTVTTSVTSLPARVSVDAVTPSVETSYTVTGQNLTGDIDLAAPSGMELALNAAGPWMPTLTLAQSGGSVATTDVFVRYNPTLNGGAPVSGPITHTSAGATTRNVSISGSVASAGGMPPPSTGGGGGGGGCTAGSSALPLAILLGALWSLRRRKQLFQ